jgi:hypothetical protein
VSEAKHYPPAARAAAKALCEAVLEGIIEPIRRVARDAGYAITVHGSLARDIDLVAVPWIEHNVSSPDYLAERVAAVIAGQLGRCNIHGKSAAGLKWTAKPHGRQAITIMAWCELFGSVDIDFSVITPHPPKDDGS